MRSPANQTRTPGFRRWCFTHFLPEEQVNQDDLRLLDFSQCNTVTYAVYQLEQCPDTGRLHYQGYLECKTSRFTAFLPSGTDRTTHWEPAHSTQEQCTTYCTKEETRIDGPWLYGYPSKGQGTRNDIISLRDAIKEGQSDRSIIESAGLVNTFASFTRFADRCRLVYSQPRSKFDGLYIFIGPTGCGKSYAASSFAEDAYYKQPDKQGRQDWWDGYAGQSTIILDEFSGELDFRALLRLCDRYPLKLQTKHGQIECQATTVLITTNLFPNEWVGEYAKADLTPLYRRTRSFFIGVGLGKFVQLNDLSEDHAVWKTRWNFDVETQYLEAQNLLTFSIQ